MHISYQGKVGPWKSIESSIYHQKSPKLGLFHPKTCEIAIARRTAEKRTHPCTHACTSHARVRIRFFNSQFVIFVYDFNMYLNLNNEKKELLIKHEEKI